MNSELIRSLVTDLISEQKSQVIREVNAAFDRAAANIALQLSSLDPSTTSTSSQFESNQKKNNNEQARASVVKDELCDDDEDANTNTNTVTTFRHCDFQNFENRNNQNNNKGIPSTSRGNTSNTNSSNIINRLNLDDLSNDHFAQNHFRNDDEDEFETCDCDDCTLAVGEQNSDIKPEAEQSADDYFSSSSNSTSQVFEPSRLLPSTSNYQQINNPNNPAEIPPPNLAPMIMESGAPALGPNHQELMKRWLHRKRRATTARSLNVSRKSKSRKLTEDSSVEERNRFSNRYVCQFENCGKGFPYRCFLRQHQWIHLNVTPWRCRWPGCPYSATDKANALRHIKVRHLGVSADQRLGAGEIDPRDYLEMVKPKI